MAQKIQAWGAFGPRLAPTRPLTAEEVVEQLVKGSNESRGSILATLAALDDVIEQGLKAGRIVHLPNGTHYRPVAKKDGTIGVAVRATPRIGRRVTAEFRGEWINRENAGKGEEEIVALWNDAHPEDPVE